MPNWLGDLVMALPILISLVKERPDVRFVLFCRSQYKEFLESLNIFSEVIIVKDVFSFFSLKYYLSFRSRYADCHLLFTNSFRGDLEAS